MNPKCVFCLHFREMDNKIMSLGIRNQKYMNLFHHQPCLKVRPMKNFILFLIGKTFEKIICLAPCFANESVAFLLKW